MAVWNVCRTGVEVFEDLRLWVSGLGCQLEFYRLLEL